MQLFIDQQLISEDDMLSDRAKAVISGIDERHLARETQKTNFRASLQRAENPQKSTGPGAKPKGS